MEFKGNRIKDFQCEEGLHDLEVMFVLQGLELAKTQDGDDSFALQKELYLNSLKTKNIPGVQDISANTTACAAVNVIPTLLAVNERIAT